MNILPTWLGSFYGCEWSRYECENIALTKFKKLRELESTCIENRWFDYARLHPVQATSYFVECYRRAYEVQSSKNFGVKRRGARLNFLESREATTFWSLRQFCDMCGFKYDWFLTLSMRRLLTNGKFKNRVPRPCHLQPKQEEVREILDAWQEHTNGQVLRLSVDPWFTTSYWEAHPQQIRYENFLVNQVAKKQVKGYAIKELLYTHGALRFERAFKEFEEEIAFAQSLAM